MKGYREEEEKKTQEYFKKLQGDDEAGEGVKKTSSIEPAEYLRRQNEYRQGLREEEERMQKTFEAMKKSFLLLTIGIIALALSFVGCCWLWPYFCTHEFSPLIQIIVLAPFIISGTAGVAALIVSAVKFFGIKKKVEGSPVKAAE